MSHEVFRTEYNSGLIVSYHWPHPLDLLLLPLRHAGDLSQRVSVGREGGVHKQIASPQARLLQLLIVLPVVQVRVGGSPHATLGVAQVDDAGAFFRHVDNYSRERPNTHINYY